MEKVRFNINSNPKGFDRSYPTRCEFVPGNRVGSTGGLNNES